MKNLGGNHNLKFFTPAVPRLWPVSPRAAGSAPRPRLPVPQRRRSAHRAQNDARPLAATVPFSVRGRDLTHRGVLGDALPLATRRQDLHIKVYHCYIGTVTYEPLDGLNSLILAEVLNPLHTPARQGAHDY